MEIKKITLINGGFKGINVEYVEPNEKEGRSKFDTIKKTIRHPIHLGLEKPFKDLRFHLLEICNIVRGDMDKKDIDFTVLECDVSGIKIDGSEFSIIGNKEAFEGKRFKIETPMVSEEDNYEHYESVAALITTIIEETKLYMQGKAVVTNEEIAERWVMAGKQKGFDADSFNALSPEEKKQLCSDILEKSFGMVVMGGEDFAIEHVSTEEIINEFKQEISEDQDTVVIEMNIAEPVKLTK